MDRPDEGSDRPGGRLPGDQLELLAAHASTRCYARGEAVYHAGSPADRWYQVESGIAARCADLSDGRRQILELLLPGDFFGFSARDEHVHGVEIVVDGTRVHTYSRRRLEALADSDPKLERVLRELAFAAIRRLEDRVVTVGRLRATERVGAFLMEMAERVPRDPGERVKLPMSRFEIADYLGLSMETVSRSIGQLKRKAAISLAGPHRFEVLDPRSLGASDGFDAPEPRTQSSGVSPSRKA